MNMLNNLEIYQVHGGLNHQAQVQKMLTSAAYSSFYTTLLGLPISTDICLAH
ncbi:MAG: hypothetical protein JSS07_09560 [Proteobacteria bacterium]|nr:hypothetical protein [Pseudomonadota bacterium]